jgi:predicted MPP superfamily phosphohydrolase
MPALFIITLLVFQVLLVFVHLTVYGTLALAFGIGSVWLEGVFVFLAVSFVIASFATMKFRNRFLDWFYTFSAYWFGLVHFLFVGSVIFYFILDYFYSHGTYVSPVLVGSICFGALFLIHLYGTWKSGTAEITKISVSLPNLPEFWKKNKLVFISDVHLGNIRGAEFSRKIVRKIQALAPAAIIIGGDIYDGPKCDAEAVVEPFRALRPPEGMWFITGNHEYYGELDRFLAAVRAVGIRILHNERVTIGGMDFIGIDYKSAHKEEDLAKIVEKLPIAVGTPTVFIKHEPDHLGIPEAAGMSFGLFGHTHQGQIFPLSLITRQMYSGFDYGLKRLGNMQVYTSSGVGTWGPPLRLGTKSEIVLVEFK